MFSGLSARGLIYRGAEPNCILRISQCRRCIRSLLFCTGIFLCQAVLAVPPFSGTIFIDPDIITEDDPTAFTRIDYAGRGIRTMFDRRVDNFVQENAYLFTAQYDDGLEIEIQVNPEFGSRAGAQVQADFYAPIFGRLPTALRRDVQTSWIHQGDELFGGGNNNLLIHTGSVAQGYINGGILEEALVHEAAHTSLDSYYANHPAWRAAQQSDPDFISTYAEDFPDREDIAESFLPYLAVRYRADRISSSLEDVINNTIPARIVFFDGLMLDMHPLVSAGFIINAGHAGAWFYPPTSGQGQFIDIEPENQTMFLSWFTYTDAASANPSEQRWLTALGKYSGNTAVLDLYETLDGKFDDPQAVTTNKIGEVTVNFSDCEQGLMSYSIPAENLHGSFPMQRVISGSGNVCQARSPIAVEAVDINAGMDGSWFDPATSGQGFFIDSHPDPEGGDLIFVSWFTYGSNTASGQRWLTALGSYAGSVAEIDIHETTGGSFNDPQAPSTTKVGTMSIDFSDCSNAQLSYSLPADPAAGDIAITRVIAGTQALCEELTGAQ